MALYTLTYGMLPSPAQWDNVWAINCPRDFYRITHGTDGRGDPARPPADDYTRDQLYTLVSRLIDIWRDHPDASTRDSAGMWASDILETLGIEWI